MNAGLERARARGVKLGRPKVGRDVEAAIRNRLAAGGGMHKVARGLGVGVSTVQRIKREAAERQPHDDENSALDVQAGRPPLAP